MKNKEIQKPFSLIMEEATQDVIESINEVSKKYGLPYYMLHEILTNIDQEIVKNIQKEKQEYFENVKKKEEKNDKNN